MLFEVLIVQGIELNSVKTYINVAPNHSRAKNRGMKEGGGRKIFGRKDWFRRRRVMPPALRVLINCRFRLLWKHYDCRASGTLPCEDGVSRRVDKQATRLGQSTEPCAGYASLAASRALTYHAAKHLLLVWLRGLLSRDSDGRSRPRCCCTPPVQVATINRPNCGIMRSYRSFRVTDRREDNINTG